MDWYLVSVQMTGGLLINATKSASETAIPALEH